MQKYIIHSFAIIGLFFVINSCMSTKQNSVNQEEYLGIQANSPEIYTNKKTDCFYSPLNMNISPMEKLVLIDFGGDSLYETIELQVYNDIRGKGATVILYAKNGENDVFYTDSVFVNQTLFKGHIFEDKGMVYSLNVTDDGLDAYILMNDKLGRKIEVKIKEEKNHNDRTSFLAPIGGIIKTFTFFPVFYMEEFNFVKRSGTAISVKIDNKILAPKKIPILLNGSFVYLSRYAAKPVICGINDQFNGELKPLIPLHENSFTDGNITYDLNNNNGHFEIKKISCADSVNIASVTFSPAIPDLMNLKEGVKISGKFSIGVNSIGGIVAGTYQLGKTGENVNLSMNPLKAYSPMSGPLWVLLYEWTANITILSNGLVNLDSKWVIQDK